MPKSGKEKRMSKKIDTLKNKIEALQAKMAEAEQKEAQKAIERAEKKERSAWVFNSGNLEYVESATGFKFNGEYYENVGDVQIPETFVSKFLPRGLFLKLLKTHEPVKSADGKETTWILK